MPSLIDTVVGQLSLQRGFVNRGQLTDCLSEGQSPPRAPLGQVLVRRRLISPGQLLELMKEADRVQLACTSCGRTYPYGQLDPVAEATCPVCGQRVLIAAGAAASDMHQTLALGSNLGADRIGSSRRTRRDDTRTSTGRMTTGAGEFSGYFGPYELLEELGRGGMGVVYKVRQPGLEREVALKILLGGDLASKHQIARFQREAEITARLKHPQIVQIHDVGTIDDHHYFTMDLVEGLPLSKLIKRKQLTTRRALEIASDVGRALDHAHARDVIHRDIKPANIIIDRDGAAVLTDFGLARERDPDVAETARLTRSGALVGTPYYMSPEQATGKAKRVGAGSDIYSLGVVLYEMLTYELPFIADTQLELTEKILNDEPPPPSEFLPELERDVETLILKTLAKTPEERYESAGEFADDIDRVLRGDDITAKRRGLLSRLWGRAKRRQRTVLLAAACVVAVIASTLAVVYVVTTLERKERVRIAKEEAERKRLAQIAAEEARQAAEAKTAKDAVAAADTALRRASLAPAGDEWRGALEGAVRRLTKALGHPLNAKDPRLLIQRGRAQERLRVTDTAVRDYQRAIQLDPNSVTADEARFRLGRLYLHTGEPKRAKVFFEEATGPPSAWRDLAKAILVMNEKQDLDGALASIGRAREHSPDAAEVLSVEADCLLAAKRHKEALSVLERAVELDSKDAHLWATLAAMRLVLEPSRGKQDVERALQLDPDHTLALSLRASDSAGEGRFEDAIADLRRVLGQRPKDVDVLFALANYYRQTNQPTLVAQMLAHMEEFAPRDPRPYRLRGLSYLMSLDFPRALAELRLGIQRCYDDPKARKELTELFENTALETRQVEIAEDYVRDLLNRKPGDPDALCFKVQALIAADRDDDAKDLLAQLRKKYPTNTRAWRQTIKFGATSWDWPLERLATEIAAYEEAHQRDADALAWLAKLFAILKIGSGAERATELARRALNIDPTNVEALTVVGLVAMNGGRTQEAQRLFMRALSIDPEHLDSLAVMGVIEYNLGNTERALMFISQVLAVEPFRPNALEGMIHVHLKARRVREAIATCQRYLEFCRLAKRPPVPQLLDLNVRALTRAGRQAEGLKTFETVADTYYAKFPEFRVALAECYASAGQKDHAKEILAAVLTDHPKLEPALKLQEQLNR